MAKEIRICNYSIKDYFVSLYEVTAKQLELLDSLIKAYDDSMLKAEAPQKEICTNLIKGVRGLARHIGCSTATAQHIVNSGELQKKGIAYRAGSHWRFNGNMLDDLLRQKPEYLNHEAFYLR